MRKAVVILLCLLYSIILPGCFSSSDNRSQGVETQNKVYKLENRYPSSDFNYPLIRKIDSMEVPYPKNGKYIISDLPRVRGSFTIYRFVAEYKGASSVERGSVTFHDMLLLKIDGSGKIRDAYQYTMEWSDVPSIDLYKMTASPVKAAQGMSVTTLSLKTVSDSHLLDEGGTIDFGSHRP